MTVIIRAEAAQRHHLKGERTMTNQEIICREAVAHGLITKAAAEAAILTGAEIPLHTYAAWKSRGYQVRKGEKATIKTSLWKRSKGKKSKETDHADQNTAEAAENTKTSGHFFLATAFLFTAAQVEEVTTH